jgi:hypothetical protein
MTEEIKTVDDMRRGPLRKELYVITSIPAAPREQLDRTRPRHLEYQTKLEKDGILFAAGPLFKDRGVRKVFAGNGATALHADLKV